MFAQWVTKGAEIGTVAFIALVVFAMFCAAVLGLLGIGAKILEDGDDKEKKLRGPRPF